MLLPLLLAAVPAPAATDAALRAAIAAAVPRHEALLERLVLQNSGTLNIAGVARVGAIMREELASLGFATRWIDMRATGRAGHLVAVHKGDGRGRRVLLIGHLDTVFEPASPFHGFAREGTRATGPGVGDDKGGLVVIVAALHAMRAAGTLARADITVVLTGDEERTGAPLERARADLVAAGRWADAALEYENVAHEDGRDFGTVARRSATNWDIAVTGVSGHSSAIFGTTLGAGAGFELARILETFRRELPEPDLSFNVGVMAAGTPAALDADGEHATAAGKTNIVAGSAVARGDLRALTPEQDARAQAQMRAIVAAHLPRTTATITFSDGYPPMAPSAGNRALLARLNAVNRDLGLPEMAEYDPARRGAADSSFVAADVDTLGGMGAVGGNTHAAGEWIDLASLPRQALRSAALIGRLTREPRQAAPRRAGRPERGGAAERQDRPPR